MNSRIKLLIEKLEDELKYTTFQKIQNPNLSDKEFSQTFNQELQNPRLQDPSQTRYDDFKYGNPISAFASSERASPKMLETMYHKFKNHTDNHPLLQDILSNPNTPPTVLKDFDDNLTNMAMGRRAQETHLKRKAPKRTTGPAGVDNWIELLKNHPNTPEEVKSKYNDFKSRITPIKPKFLGYVG